MREALNEFLEDTPVRRGAVGDSSEALCSTIAGDLRRTRYFVRTGNRPLEEIDEDPADRGQCPVLPLYAAQPLRSGGPRHRPRPNQRGAGWRRWSSRSPSVTTWRSARKLNRAVAECSPSPTSTASIITSARKPFRMSSPSASETASSSRFGTGDTWTTSRSRPPNRSASKGAAVITRRRARLRDMIQNHLLQVMATIAMEPPAVFEPDVVRDERAKVLRSIRIMKPEDVPRISVAGQYGHRPASATEELPGFREEDGVDPKLRPTLTLPSLSSSTTGAGRTCRSIFAAASGCPSASPISRSSSTPRRILLSAGSRDDGSSSRRTC